MTTSKGFQNIWNLQKIQQKDIFMYNFLIERHL